MSYQPHGTMSAISQRDCEAMLACVARLYECADVQQFARAALEEMPKLIGADHSTFNYLAPSVPKAVVAATHEPPDHAKRQRIFARYMGEHPVLNHYLATGDGSAHLTSDFLPVREYHALQLYQYFYRELRYEDQLSCVFFPPGPEVVAFSLARDERSFTERDRRILNLLRPQLARAYRHVERTALLHRAWKSDPPAQPEAQVTSVLLDSEDRPVQFGAEAQRWLSRFFPGCPRDPARLPEAVTQWLQRTRKRDRRAPMSSGRDAALVRERGGQRLRLRVMPALSGSGRLLVLGLEPVPGAAYALLARELTPREIEVLLEVELGKTNEEVAATLGISPLTVRCHLEHIFDKLHVPSRTAAVTQFRRRCAGLS